MAFPQLATPLIIMYRNDNRRLATLAAAALFNLAANSNNVKLKIM